MLACQCRRMMYILLPKKEQKVTRINHVESTFKIIDVFYFYDFHAYLISSFLSLQLCTVSWSSSVASWNGSSTVSVEISLYQSNADVHSRRHFERRTMSVHWRRKQWYFLALFLNLDEIFNFVPAERKLDRLQSNMAANLKILLATLPQFVYFIHLFTMLCNVMFSMSHNFDIVERMRFGTTPF